MSRHLRLATAFLRRRPVWCSWQVTRRCASFCMFCDHRKDAAEEELDADGCLRVAERLAGWGALVVSLTGGDPYLRSDLPAVIAAVARHHFPLLTTHGWLVTEEKARAAWQAGLEGATVRLHGTDRARHEAATGMPGSWARAMAALSAFSTTRTSARQRVNVKVRLEGDEVDGLDALLLDAERRGATVTVEPAFPLGSGRAAGVAGRLVALKARHPNFRSAQAYLRRFDEALSGGVGGCQAARAFVNVDHRGRISKCLEFQGEGDRVGDLTREGLDAVAPRLRRVHEENACRSCWYASRGEVESLYTTRGLVSALPELVRA